MTLYRIQNWEKIYENNRSRTVKDLAWVAIPNRHDGEGYSTIMAHTKAAEIFTAWILLLQVASRCQPRGSLVRDNGRPHTPQTLAIKTRGKTEWFAFALEFLSSAEIGWIRCEQVTERENDAAGCQPPDMALTVSCQSGDEEQNRTEQNGTEQKTYSRFIKPVIEEAKLHAAKIGLPISEAEKFFSYYESNGWRVGRNPMKSWQAAMVNWKRNWQERRGPRIPEPTQTQEALQIPRL